jgi:simple sugar transport system ATP-binding protein
MGALSGETGSPMAGSIRILGTDAIGLNPAARRSLGAVFVPEERIGHAAVADMTLVDNSYLTGDTRMNFSHRGLIDWPAVTRFTQKVVQNFDVRTTGVDALASSLSGGNLQKFIVGREILQQPSLLVVSQPTWGVDAGAAAAIHEEIQRLVSAGAAVLMISQDLDEVFLLSHRIAVISQGTLSVTTPIDEVSPEDIGLLMGVRHEVQPKVDHVAA